MKAYLRSRRWALGYGLVLAVLVALPYAAAWQAQGQAWRFSGFLMGVEDGNSYLAKMLLGARGAWLFRPPYTTWRLAPLPVFLPYLWLGKLAAGAGLHLQLAVLFHWARLVGVVAWVLATYDFSALFLPAERWRRWAVVLATAGAGLGWLLVPWARLSWAGPLCFYSPETYGFLAALLLPHLLWARALLLWILRRVLLASPRRMEWQAAALAALLAWLHPLELLPLVAVLGGWGGGTVLWAWWRQGKPEAIRRARQIAPRAGPALAVASLAAGGYAWLARVNPYLRVWTAQNLLPSPPWWQYGLAYGWLLPFAWWGRWRWRRGGWRTVLPLVWVALSPALVYAPLTVQRRLADGVWVAWAVLAAAGLAEAARRWGHSRVRKLAWGVLGMAVVPNVLVLVGVMGMAFRHAPPAFLPEREVAAFQALGAQVASGDGVLAAYATGNALPAWAPVRVVAGLGPESPHLAVQEAALRQFFSPATPDSWRRVFLQENHLRWVFWGPAERALGGWDPHQSAWLCLRYEQNGYAFWEVCR